MLPTLALPAFDFGRVIELVPSAFAIAMLGAIATPAQTQEARMDIGQRLGLVEVELEHDPGDLHVVARLEAGRSASGASASA